jgi:hypothetical protein
MYALAFLASLSVGFNQYSSMADHVGFKGDPIRTGVTVGDKQKKLFAAGQ